MWSLLRVGQSVSCRVCVWGLVQCTPLFVPAGRSHWERLALVGAEGAAWAGSAQCAPLVVLAGRSLWERLALVGAECIAWACVCAGIQRGVGGCMAYVGAMTGLCRLKVRYCCGSAQLVSYFWPEAPLHSVCGYATPMQGPCRAPVWPRNFRRPPGGGRTSRHFFKSFSLVGLQAPRRGGDDTTRRY